MPSSDAGVVEFIACFVCAFIRHLCRWIVERCASHDARRYGRTAKRRHRCLGGGGGPHLTLQISLLRVGRGQNYSISFSTFAAIAAVFSTDIATSRARPVGSKKKIESECITS